MQGPICGRQRHVIRMLWSAEPSRVTACGHYRIVPGTVSAGCDRYRSACRISGTIQWKRRSRTGKVSIGSARLILTFDPSKRKIVRESALLLNSQV